MSASQNRYIINLIVRVAGEFNLDASYMLTMAYIESGFNPRALNQSSKAAGLYQFIPSTAKYYRITNPFDAEQSARGAARLTQDNRSYIAKHGVPLDPEFLYLAHQQGAAGCVAIYNAAYRNRPLPANIRRNMNGNGGFGKTALQFIDHWKALYSRKKEQAAKFLMTT